jgi:cobalt-zinc-cadmium resistance protein CzcA
LLPGVKLQLYEAGEPAANARKGAFFLRGEFPATATFEQAADQVRSARELLAEFPEVRGIVSQTGQADDGGEAGFAGMAEFLVLLKPQGDWPAPSGRDQPRKLAGLKEEMVAAVEKRLPGTYWVSASEGTATAGPLARGEGEQVVKLFGPDLAALQKLAQKVRDRLAALRGVDRVWLLSSVGRPRLEFTVDREKCKKWGIQVADVLKLINTVTASRALGSVVEGEQAFNLVLSWPQARRQDAASILDVPVDIATGIAPGIAPGQQFAPRLRLRDLVSPVGEDGRPDPKGTFMRPGVSVIYREHGQRFVALRFRVRGRSAAEVLAEARAGIAPLLQAPYRAEWSH